jgi:hypothetical protein
MDRWCRTSPFSFETAELLTGMAAFGRPVEKSWVKERGRQALTRRCQCIRRIILSGPGIYRYPDGSKVSRSLSLPLPDMGSNHDSAYIGRELKAERNGMIEMKDHDCFLGAPFKSTRCPPRYFKMPARDGARLFQRNI